MDTFPGAGLPGNSHKSRTEEPPKAEESASETPKPKFEKVINGNAKPRKRTLGDRAKAVFIQEGIDYKRHVVENIIFPKIRETLYKIVEAFADGVKESVDEALNGGKPRSSAVPRPGETGRVNYQKLSTTVASVSPRIVQSSTIAKSNVVREINLEERADGELVIAQLKDGIARYGHVTVGDLYALIDFPIRNTDHEWGWTSVDSARVRPITGGQFRLVLPGPEPIS